MILNNTRFSVEVRIEENTKICKEEMPFLVEVELFSPRFVESIRTVYMGIRGEKHKASTH